MLQKLALTVAFVAAPLLLAVSMTATSSAATLGVYTIDLVATGYGEDVNAARADAVETMATMVANLNLPAGHVVAAVNITDEFADPPKAYVVEFEVVVWDGNGPPPPGIK